MRLAWFRPTPPDTANPVDDTAALVEALRATHAITIVTAANAHDLVWMHGRQPFDLCVYELDNTAAHQFVWPYLLHYPGVTLLRTMMVHDSRASALMAERRGSDYRAELEFNRDWRLLRVPLLASRLTVVAHPATADALQHDYPDATIRVAPIGVRGCEGATVRGCDGATVRIGIIDSNRGDVIRNALERARAAGVDVGLTEDASADDAWRDADVVLALRWPMFGEPPIAALAAMAAAKPVVVLETEVTADWPAYDPQTWRPRAGAAGAPIAVSLDPRDEEHSLMVALRDLARDAEMRQQIGAAAQAWVREHASVTRAADAWQRILAEACALPPRALPEDWPAHLRADGTDALRTLLRETGASVDFL